VGVSQGENKTLEHCFIPTATGVQIININDRTQLEKIKSSPDTIQLWLITNASEPLYELIKKPHSTKIAEEKGDADMTGYETDIASEQKLQRDTKEYLSTHMVPEDVDDSDEETEEKLVWIRNGIGRRVLSNTYRSSLTKDLQFLSFLRQKGHQVNDDTGLIVQLSLTKIG